MKNNKMNYLSCRFVTSLCDFKSAFFVWGLYDIINDGNPPLSVRSVIDKLTIEGINVSAAC